MKNAEMHTVTRPKPNGFGVRHVQVFMLFFAMFIAFSIRSNMSLAIVSITDKTNENAFDWSIQTQSVILSSFFWGYVVLQIPGGELAARFGGKILFTLSIGINSVVSLAIPVGASYGGWQFVCACRVIQGLSQAFIYPASHNLIGKWIPLEEKSRLATIIYSGGQLGNAVQLLVSGFIAEYWGWPAIFYANGTMGALWTAVYIFVGAASPQESSFIIKEEMMYIQSSLSQDGGVIKKAKTPWKSACTSVPFISLLIVHCCHNWGYFTLMTEIPTYMSQIQGVNIKSNGMLSALPYLAMFLMSFPLGFLSDLMLKKKWLSVSSCRKVCNSIGHYGPAIALIGLSYSPPGNVAAAVAILVVVNGLNAGHLCGFLIVHTDLAPRFAGTLMGITNCAANIVSIIAPLAAGLILLDETDPYQWRIVFYLASAIFFFGNTVFLIFGSCKVQPWNSQNDNDRVDKEKQEEDGKTS